MLLTTRLVATVLQDLTGLHNGLASATFAVSRIRRQHHQTQLPVVRHIHTVGEHMDATKQSASKALLGPLANSREDIFLVLVALLSLLHFTTQVRARIEPVEVL